MLCPTRRTKELGLKQYQWKNDKGRKAWTIVTEPYISFSYDSEFLFSNRF